jgi:hypothetical protein
MGTISLDDIHDPISTNGQPFFAICRTHAAVEEYGIDMDPDYQRGHVWTTAQQSAFVGHLLEGGRVQPLIINQGPDGQMNPAELVDGKQRMTACLAWSRDEIPAVISDGRKFYLSDLDEDGQRQCRMGIGMIYGIVMLTRPECLKLYLRLNSCGVAHTEAELARVREMLAKEAGE